MNTQIPIWWGQIAGTGSVRSLPNDVNCSFLDSMSTRQISCGGQGLLVLTGNSLCYSAGAWIVQSADFHGISISLPFSESSIVGIVYDGRSFIVWRDDGSVYSLKEPTMPLSFHWFTGTRTHVFEDLFALSPLATLSSYRVSKVSCGHQHCLFLLHDGRVASQGGNELGQLGIEGTTRALSPCIVKSLKEGVNAVACGTNHSLAITVAGELYQWGFGRACGSNGKDLRLPERIAHPSLTCFRQVSGGDSHSLALSDDGTVVAWGSNEYGQTGVGKDAWFICVPQIVPSKQLTGRVTSISCSSDFSSAVTVEGELFLWGKNSFVIDPEASADARFFDPVRMELNYPVAQVACSTDQAVLITGQPTVIEPQSNVTSPSLLQPPENELKEESVDPSKPRRTRIERFYDPSRPATAFPPPDEVPPDSPEDTDGAEMAPDKITETSLTGRTAVSGTPGDASEAILLITPRRMPAKGAMKRSEDASGQPNEKPSPMEHLVHPSNYQQQQHHHHHQPTQPINVQADVDSATTRASGVQQRDNDESLYLRSLVGPRPSLNRHKTVVFTAPAPREADKDAMIPVLHPVLTDQSKWFTVDDEGGTRPLGPTRMNTSFHIVTLYSFDRIKTSVDLKTEYLGGAPPEEPRRATKKTTKVPVLLERSVTFIKDREKERQRVRQEQLQRLNADTPWGQHFPSLASMKERPKALGRSVSVRKSLSTPRGGAWLSHPLRRTITAPPHQILRIAESSVASKYSMPDSKEQTFTTFVDIRSSKLLLGRKEHHPGVHYSSAHSS